MTITIVAFSGSLRSKSLNSMLLDTAIELAPSGTTIERASIADIPLYDGDLEARAFPEAVTALKDRVIAAHGLLIVTPEYNNSIPGVAKNVIDWLSRPSADIPKVFRERPVGIMGATPGMGGTNLSQAAWLPVLRTLGTLPFFGGRIGLSGADKLFDEHGKLADEKARGQIEKYVAAFAKFVARHSPTAA